MFTPSFRKALIAFALLFCAAPALADPLVVRVREGVVRGAAQDGVRVFRNIPYAAPPLGDLRWRGPAAALAWSGVRDATLNGRACDMPDWTHAPAATRTAGPGWTMWTRDVPADLPEPGGPARGGHHRDEHWRGDAGRVRADDRR